MQGCGGSSGAITAEAGGGEEDHTGFNDAIGDSDGECRGPASNDLSKGGYLRLKKESKKQRRKRQQRERERGSAGLFLSDVEFNGYYEWCIKGCQKSGLGVRATWGRDYGMERRLKLCIGRDRLAGRWPEL